MTATNDDVGRPPLDLRGKRVWVSGHRGMVGSALVRRLAREDCTLLFVDRAEAYGARNGVPGELLCRLRPTRIASAKDVAD